MRDKNPCIRISLPNDEKFYATPDNTILYTFAGHTAVGDVQFDNTNVDHVFVKMGAEGTGSRGMYFFKAFSPNFSTMVDYMTENEFPSYLHMREIPSCDMKAYLDEVEHATSQ